MSVEMKTKLQEDGFFLVKDAVGRDALSELAAHIDSVSDEEWERRRDGTRFAIRNAHLKIENLWSALERAELFSLAAEILSTKPEPVSAVVFDKPEGAKWSVPAHQDVVYPVAGEGPLPGFSNWSQRHGVTYARLSQGLLSSMIALRVHCDDCSEDGALEVVPGSHHSILPSDEVMDMPLEQFISCPGDAGSVLIMKPQLVHRSGPSGVGARRRVLHVVFAGERLPDGISWTWKRSEY